MRESKPCEALEGASGRGNGKYKGQKGREELGLFQKSVEAGLATVQ